MQHDLRMNNSFLAIISDYLIHTFMVSGFILKILTFFPDFITEFITCHGSLFTSICINIGNCKVFFRCYLILNLRAIAHKSDSRPAQPISPNFLFFCWLIGLMEGVNGCINFWGSAARGGSRGGGLFFSS